MWGFPPEKRVPPWHAPEHLTVAALTPGDNVPHMTGNDWQNPAAIADLLDNTTTWAVVGLSDNTGRPAYGVAQVLQAHGKRIVPIHPDAAGRTVLGETAYAKLADVPFPIDVVDVFRRSEAAGQFADEAAEIGARGVWFQLGVIDADAFERTRAAGLAMVMDACPAIEWGRRR
jgi:uncharacterized protein